MWDSSKQLLLTMGVHMFAWQCIYNGTHERVYFSKKKKKRMIEYCSIYFRKLCRPIWSTALRGRGSIGMKSQRSARRCLVFLSLEPSWHSRLTVKPTQKQQRCGEVKQSWHLRTRAAGRWIISFKEQIHQRSAGNEHKWRKNKRLNSYLQLLKTNTAFRKTQSL